MKKYYRHIFIITLLIYCLIWGGCNSENLELFNAVVLKVEDSKILIYRKDAVDDRLAYVSIEKNTLIQDLDGNELSLNDISEELMISIYYEDQVLSTIGPPTYKQIKKVVVTNENNNYLYNEGMKSAKWHLG